MKKENILNSVDCIFDINNRYVLLIKRGKEPYKNDWALPGGIQEPFESLSKALLRLIRNRLGLDIEIDDKHYPNTINFKELDYKSDLHQLRTYDSGTDPRGGNTTVFSVQLNINKTQLEKLLKAGNFVDKIKLFSLKDLPKLAFDHENFIDDYYKNLKSYDENAENYDVTKYEHPSVTTDMAVFSIQDERLKVLLVKRKAWPFKDHWALPGGFVQMDENLDETAKRELEEETGVKDVYLEQLYSFGEPKRDPRTRVITVSYFALIKTEGIKLRAATDVSEVGWFSVGDLPKLAFDHDKILSYAIQRLKWKLEYTTVAFSLLSKKFTLTDLQVVYEAVFEKKFDKRNFRKKILTLNLLKEEGLMEGQANRPPMMYSFKCKLGQIVKMV
jgi:8-oxo-dGTP diphosphatase